MGLETRRIREIRKPTEEIKDEYSLKDMKKLIDSLPSDDIDQQWVRENESKEFSFATPKKKNDDDQRVQGVFNRMPRISDFGKNARLSSELKKESGELNESKSQSIMPTPEEIISLFGGTSFQPLESSSKIEETVQTGLESSIQPPTIDPEPQIVEELQQQESVIVDNTELIAELSSKIDKKYNRLLSELSNLYNSKVINQEANDIKGDLQSIMEIKYRSLEELTKVDTTLNSLLSKFAKLSQRADEIKATDDFRINQQQQQLSSLRVYQSQLENNYGKFWLAKMSKQEQEEYITLYSAAHNVPKEEVEKRIEDSIALAYDEIVASKNQRKEQQQEASAVQDSQPQQEQQLDGNYESMFRTSGKQALEKLKQIYSGLQSATPEQIDEFSYLYSALSELGKTKLTNPEEEKQKLTQLYDIADRINQLQSGMSNSNGKSR